MDINSLLPIFNKWVKDIEHEMMKNPNPELVGFQSRLASHCLKLSVLFCVGEFGPQTRYILGLDHLSKGIALATWLHKQATELAETGFIKSKFEQQIQHFLTLCGKPGGISRKDAMRSLHLAVRDFDNLVGTARERGEIEIDIQKTETKNKTVYQLVKEEL